MPENLRLRADSQRFQIAANQCDCRRVLLDKNRVLRAPAERFDPHRSGTRVKIHKRRSLHCRAQNIEKVSRSRSLVGRSICPFKLRNVRLRYLPAITRMEKTLGTTDAHR